MDYAVVAYPLSLGFRQRVEEKLECAPNYLSLAELRRMTMSGMVRRLRALNADRLIVPLEDENSRAILPIILPLCSLVRTQRIEVVFPDLSSSQVSRLHALGSALRLIAASLRGGIAAIRCSVELDRLLKQPRQQVRQSTGKVIYLKTNLWFGVKAGGSVGHIAGVVNGFLRRGLGVDFASAEAPIMVDDGCRFLPVRVPEVFGPPAELNYYRFQRSFVRQVLQVTDRNAYAFVYQRLSTASYAGPIIARTLGIPLIVEYNGSEVWIARNWGRKLRFQELALKSEKALLRHAHVVVTVSEVLRDELVEARGVEPERIVCYPNCVDPRVFDPARFSPSETSALRARHGISDDATVITFIGTFGMWHGVERLAGAIKLLVDTQADWLERNKVVFLLVGDGVRRAAVEELIGRDPRYQPFFRMVGLVPQAEAPAYLMASDVLVSPHVRNEDGSRFFGSPTKLFEYMAMGKAIVASDLDQIGEVLKHSLRWPVSEVDAAAADTVGHLAILTAAGDEKGLADAMKFLVERSALRQTLGHNARKEALSRYTWDRHVQAIVDRINACS